MRWHGMCCSSSHSLLYFIVHLQGGLFAVPLDFSQTLMSGWAGSGYVLIVALTSQNVSGGFCFSLNSSARIISDLWIAAETAQATIYDNWFAFAFGGLYYWWGSLNVIFMVRFTLTGEWSLCFPWKEGPKANIWKNMTNGLCQFAVLCTFHCIEGYRRVLLNDSMAHKLIFILKMQLNEDRVKWE